MANSMKKLAILGSTGSIGRQTLQVVRNLASRFRVIGLTAGQNLNCYPSKSPNSNQNLSITNPTKNVKLAA